MSVVYQGCGKVLLLPSNFSHHTAGVIAQASRPCPAFAAHLRKGWCKEELTADTKCPMPGARGTPPRKRHTWPGDERDESSVPGYVSFYQRRTGVQCKRSSCTDKVSSKARSVIQQTKIAKDLYISTL